MKTLHKLKSREHILYDFYVFDVETNGLRAKSDAFLFGVIYSRNFINIIYSVDEFKKEFKKDRYNKRKVFAHNAEYDLSVIYDNIYDFDKQAIFNNRFIYATNGNCQFADSMNIYPASVKRIGELLGIKKLGIEKEYLKGNVKTVTKKMLDYCIRDCEIIYEALFRIFNEVESIKITLAGLSLDYFRRKFQPFNIDYNNKLVNHFFNSYYGGRNEAFFIGKIDAVCYDINSMYPYAMVMTSFPNPKYLQQKIIGVTPDRFINHYLQFFEGCANVTVLHYDKPYGFLPLRKNGKLLFPVGRFTAWYNFNELRFAIKYGAIKIKKVHNVIYSQKMKSPFIDYAVTLYEKRKNDVNELNREIYKLLLNSLYGKFAQKIKSETIYIENIDKQFNIIQQYQQKKLFIKIVPFNNIRKDCFIEVKSRKGFLYHSIPLFSSYITSYARIVLLSKILKYQNFNPVYCDTDSIFYQHDPEITSSNKLGEFKREKKLITEIRGLKNYSYIGENKKHYDKIKGIPKSAEKVQEKYIYKNLLKTREAMRRKLEPGVIVEREKILKLTYEKRIVLKNGQTKPLKL